MINYYCKNKNGKIEKMKPKTNKQNFFLFSKNFYTFATYNKNKIMINKKKNNNRKK